MADTLAIWLQLVAIYELELHVGGQCEVALDDDEMVYVSITTAADFSDCSITFEWSGGDK